MIPKAAGLAELADRYDLFLVDQFGVLHDGSTAYPGAVEALGRLKAAGKTVILVSNSGKRAADNQVRLARLGFDPSSYDAFVSSGEVVWRLIADDQVPVPTTIPRPLRCLLVNRRGDETTISGLGLDLADSAETADFVLLTGSDGDIRPLTDYRTALTPAAARRLPCLCANPDKVMILAEGTGYGAGAIADLYTALGGQVTWIGKPYTEIYRHALEEAGRFGCKPDPSRVIGIGDSIEHDIAGAKHAGFAAALVTAGIHFDDDEAMLAAAMQTHSAVPDQLLDRFAWHA